MITTITADEACAEANDIEVDVICRSTYGIISASMARIVCGDVIIAANICINPAAVASVRLSSHSGERVRGGRIDMVLFNTIEIRFYPRHEYKLLQMLRTTSKIATIKHYRDNIKKRRVSLLEAKEHVQRVAEKYGLVWSEIR